MAIDFDDTQRARIEQALVAYVRDHFGHEMGELQSRRMFEFVVGLVGASAYNQAIADAEGWLQVKVTDLAGDLHERVEFEG